MTFSRSSKEAMVFFLAFQKKDFARVLEIEMIDFEEMSWKELDK